MCLEACRGDRALIQLILAGHRQVDCKKLNCWTTYRWIAAFHKCAQNTWFHCYCTNWFTTVIIEWPIRKKPIFHLEKKQQFILYQSLWIKYTDFFQYFHIGAIEKEGISQNSIFWTSLQPLSISNLSCFSQNHPFLLLPHLSLKSDRLWDKKGKNVLLYKGV